ncbi:Rpp14/Pop5 family-domain-containing protein [Delphinella strobiligena]|nr:Rpp14/Pop5 family-domain-containing protein [Delphinella strobiligena]
MVRLKHRYLLINILYPESAANSSGVQAKDATMSPDTIQFHQPTSDKLTPQLLARIVREGVAELFGDYGSGMSAASLVVKYLSPATSTAIIRVSRDHYRLVWAALSFVTKLPRPVDQSCVIQVVRVSGTIRKAEEEAIRRAKASIIRAQRKKGDAAGDILGKMMAQEEDEDVQMGGIVDGEDEEDEDEDEE